MAALSSRRVFFEDDAFSDGILATLSLSVSLGILMPDSGNGGTLFEDALVIVLVLVLDAAVDDAVVDEVVVDEVAVDEVVVDEVVLVLELDDVALVGLDVLGGDGKDTSD
jgi:hypothetical protein